LGHAIRHLTRGSLSNTMFLAKGSLFLGRITRQSDGISFLLEKNKGGA
jgi:betaine reductase